MTVAPTSSNKNESSMFSSTYVDPVSTELGYDLLRAEESMARKGTMDAAVFDPLVKVQPEVWSKSIDRVRALNAVLRSEGCFQGLMGTFWKKNGILACILNLPEPLQTAMCAD